MSGKLTIGPHQEVSDDDPLKEYWKQFNKVGTGVKDFAISLIPTTHQELSEAFLDLKLATKARHPLAIAATYAALRSPLGKSVKSSLNPVKRIGSANVGSLQRQILGSKNRIPAGEVGAIVQEINDGGYRQINRYWEATPTEICEAAVDEISKFVLDPTSYKDVMANLQKIADNSWDNN